MSRERLYRTDGIILRRRDYGEADRVLTVFTPRHGKLQLLAKGVRKISSRKAGHIELFTLVDLLLAKGRTWDIISQAQTVESYRGLREDLHRTSTAYYLAELVDKFVEQEDINPPVFELLAVTLTHLSHAADRNLLSRYFELRLLSLSGYQPQLHLCLACQSPLEPQQNYFIIAEGGMFCPHCAAKRSHTEPVPLPVLKVMRFLQTRPWEQVAGLQLTNTTHLQTETLLLRYITYTLERRLKSVDFIYRLRKQEAS